MRYTLILLAAIFSLFVAACSNGGGQEEAGDGKRAKIMTVAEFKTQFQDFDGIILDVRTPEEVAEGVIPGAIHINIHDNDFADQVAQLDQSKPVVAYCKMGGRSAMACEALKQLDFPEIYNLEGGITRWNKEGGALEMLD